MGAEKHCVRWPKLRWLCRVLIKSCLIMEDDAAHSSPRSASVFLLAASALPGYWQGAYSTACLQHGRNGGTSAHRTHAGTDPLRQRQWSLRSWGLHQSGWHTHTHTHTHACMILTNHFLSFFRSPIPLSLSHTQTTRMSHTPAHTCHLISHTSDIGI